MTELHKVEGKSFLITGGASGLGAGYAEAFLEHGARFVVILDISEKAGKEIEARLNKLYPGKVMFLSCDVSNEENLTNVFNEAVKVTNLDVIINNAGVMNDSANMWMKTCDINFRGTASLTFKGIKHMRKDEGGSGGTIINVSSTAALLKFPHVPTYSATKAAILHFDSCIAMGQFHERFGVRILTMCIGPTDTAIYDKLDKLSYDEQFGKELDKLVKQVDTQKLESAVNAVVEAFKQGANGSIWLATKDRPLQNITPVIDEAHEFIRTTLNL